MEIERKWLIGGFPQNLPLVCEAAVRQGYVATAPVVRIRESVQEGAARYVLCFKGKGTLAREEIETDIDADTFRKLEAFIGKPLVTKEFKVYRLPGGELLEVKVMPRYFSRSKIPAEIAPLASCTSRTSFWVRYTSVSYTHLDV